MSICCPVSTTTMRLASTGRSGPIGTPTGARAAEVTDGDALDDVLDAHSSQTKRVSAPQRGDNTDREGAREVNVTATDRYVQLPLKPEALRWYQRHDRNCRAIAHRLNHGKWPRYAPPYLKRQPADSFRLSDGLIFRVYGDQSGSWQVVWPLAKRYELFYAHHDTSDHAHGGYAKMYELLSRHAWYPGIRADCEDYVRTCERCDQRKSSQGHTPPLLPQVADWPNQTLVIDIASLPRSVVTGRSLVLTSISIHCFPHPYINPRPAGGGGAFERPPSGFSRIAKKNGGAQRRRVFTHLTPHLFRNFCENFDPIPYEVRSPGQVK